jgi:hypothetical protein
MAKIALPEPLVLANATIKIATDNYEAATSGVTFTPSVPTSTVAFKAIDGSAYSKTTQGASTWVCGIDFAQDWKTTGSLSNYLHDHEGEEVEAVFVPEAGTGMPSFTATITIQPGAIGGAADGVATASVSLPSTKPVKALTA